MNEKEFVQYVELYKTEKITEYSFEKELSKIAQSLIRNAIQVSVKICDNKRSATSSTFLIATLPEINVGTKLTILIDKKAIKSLLSPEEVIGVLTNEALNHQSILKEYSHFIVNKLNSDISVSDVLMMLFSIYKLSLVSVYEKFPEVVSRLLDSKSIPTLELINRETEILANGKERLDVVMERLIINDILPYGFVELAREMAQKMRNDYLNDVNSKGDNVTKPEYNSFWKHQRSMVDGTYQQISGKNVPHDYKPNTN